MLRYAGKQLERNLEERSMNNSNYLKSIEQDDIKSYAASLVMARAAFLKSSLEMSQSGLFSVGDVLPAKESYVAMMNNDLKEVGLERLCVAEAADVDDEISAYIEVLKETAPIVQAGIGQTDEPCYLVISLTAGKHYVVKFDQLAGRYPEWDERPELASRVKVYDYWMPECPGSSVVRLS